MRRNRLLGNLVKQLGCRGEPLPQVRCCNQRRRDRLSRACCDYVASIELSLVTRKREKKRERESKTKEATERRSIVNSDGYEAGCGTGKQHKYFATGSSELSAATGADGDVSQPDCRPLHLSTIAQSCAAAKSS